MADFTPTQGRYMAFIHAYTELHGYPPAEADIAAAMCVSPPSVNNMVKTLEKKGLLARQPGQPRTLRILIPHEEIPPWGNRKASTPSSGSGGSPPKKKPTTAAAPVRLYVLTVFLTEGPVSKKSRGKEISRTIEIRGDQTLEELHEIIFDAYDRDDEHMYEFQFGKRPRDPKGPNYGLQDYADDDQYQGDVRDTKLDDLGLNQKRVFGYWFDFGDNWFHQIQVERIESAIPTVTYPRIIKRVGKSPPQYGEEM